MPKLIDMTGMRFGRLTVLHRGDNIGTKPAWVCVCDCGANRLVDGASLRTGKTKSCGCYHSEVARNRMTKYSRRSRRLYEVYSAMRDRCLNQNSPEYKSYGGRGICICDEWLRNIGAFYEWAYSEGYDDNAPRGKYTLDRIDNNGNYCPDNCRWVSQKQQQRNTSRNVNLTYNGETHCIAEWAEMLGFSFNTLQQRIKKGWSIERALTEPIYKGKERKHNDNA